LLAEVDRARTIMQAHDAAAKGAVSLAPRHRDECLRESEAARKSLGQTQALLADLFTNAPLRREFFAHPERAALDFGLTADKASTLKAVDAKSVALYVDSLSQKRLADARKTLPLTARARRGIRPTFTARTRCAAKRGTPSRRRRETGRAHRARRRRGVTSAVDCRSCSI
jgi:hypothetical protein